MKKICLNTKLTSWHKVIIGMILGIIIGMIFGETIAWLKYLGILFLNMIKMVTIPLIFFTIVYGITSVENHRGLGKVSIKAIVIFLSTAVTAACIGLLVTSIIKPGFSDGKAILNMMSNMQKHGISVASGGHNSTSIVDFVINIIPNNIVSAAAEGNILQVIAFAFFCGVTLNKNRTNCENVIKIFHQIAQMLFSMIESIMKFAPFGVFGYMATLAAVEGLTPMITLGRLIITIMIGCTVQYIFFGIVLFVFGRISPLPFYRKIIDIQMLAFSTSSSKAVLVPMMQACEKRLGISKEGSRFILPLSAALNMDGGAIYQASCVVFFSQIYGINFGLHEYVIIILMSTIASIGGAGIPSGVLLFLGMVLHAVGMPIDGVLVVATVDRILDMLTTAINVTGDIFATLLIETSEKKLNKQQYYAAIASTEKEKQTPV